MEEKKCSRCGKVKPVSEFSRVIGPQRYQSRCKQCRHEAYIEERDRKKAQEGGSS